MASKGRWSIAASFDVERLAIRILGTFDLDEHPEPLLLRIAILLRLDEPLPDFLVDRSRTLDLGGPVETRDAPLWQRTGFAQRNFAQEDRDLSSVGQIGVAMRPNARAA
jgi:hypothetical protein